MLYVWLTHTVPPDVEPLPEELHRASRPSMGSPEAAWNNTPSRLVANSYLVRWEWHGELNLCGQWVLTNPVRMNNYGTARL